MDAEQPAAVAKLREIVAHCEQQQRLLPGKGAAVVTYVLPGRHANLDRRRRLWKGGPLGRPVGWERGGVVVMFDAETVRRAATDLLAILESDGE